MSKGKKRMTKAKWIWADTPVRADEYVSFCDEFLYSSGQVTADISVAGEYALYINGALAAFGQYPDYAHYKVFDRLDLTPYVQKGIRSHEKVHIKSVISMSIDELTVFSMILHTRTDTAPHSLSRC